MSSKKPSEEITVTVDSHLTFKEMAALRTHKAANEPPLSANKANELYQLFLIGMGCEEIAAQDRSIRLGQIVRAHEEFGWVDRRHEYQVKLQKATRDRMVQAQTESIGFMALALQSLNRKFSKAFITYLQSGKEEDLGDAKDWNFHQYKQIMELMLKSSGQDSTKRVQVGGEIQHTGVGDSTGQIITNGPLSPSDAVKMLAALQGIQVKGEE